MTPASPAARIRQPPPARPPRRPGPRPDDPRSGPETRRRPWRDDRGSDAVELAILLPIALILMAFLVIGARIALAGDRIAGVAGAAAREASLARTPDTATVAARDAATAALTSAGLHCTAIDVSVDTSGFAVPAGRPATVTVDVSCTVDLSDIAAPGLPGHKTLHDRAVSPIDITRGTR